MNYLKKRGFTLIELLVVISIIGLLSSIVLASLQESRQKARDSEVISGIIQLRNAIALYREENNNNYPGDLDELVSGGYIPSLPPNDSGRINYSYENSWPDYDSGDNDFYNLCGSTEGNANGFFRFNLTGITVEDIGLSPIEDEIYSCSVSDDFNATLGCDTIPGLCFPL